MGYYRAVDQETLTGGAMSGLAESRYAWLELEDGTWHFLNSLFADPTNSTRRWSSRQRALDELTKEGWVIVGSYPENSPASRPVCGGSRVYGLMQVGHWQGDISIED